MNCLFGARTHFSMGESLLSPKELVETARDRGYECVALCDTMTISGMMEFIAAAKQHEIKPIIGCRLRIVYDLDYRKPAKSEMVKPKENPEWYPKVFVKNEQGMADLMDLLTLANSESRFYFVPRLSLKDLLPVLAKGNLEITTGDLFSVFHCSLGAYNYQSIIDSINSVISDSKAILELSCINTLLYSTITKKALKYALEREYRAEHILLSYPTFYKNESDAGTRDVLATILSNNKIKDPWRHIPAVRDMHIKKVSELTGVFDEFCRKHEQPYQLAWAASDRLTDVCQYTWEKKAISLPTMAENETKAIIDAVQIGWANRIKKEFMGYKPDESLLPVYKERLVYELNILRDMKFERYFLLVQDIIKWSKENGIMVGPGRGSCFLAGSRVALDKSGLTEVIENIKPGDFVLAHDGSTRQVTALLEFERDEEITELEFDNGVIIECTRDHKFFTKNRGWVTAENLTFDDEFDDVTELAKKTGD